MKKNLLIIVSLVLCLILNMVFNPTIVKADEVNENEISLNENENSNNDEEQKENNEKKQELELENNDSTNESSSEEDKEDGELNNSKEEPSENLDNASGETLRETPTNTDEEGNDNTKNDSNDTTSVVLNETPNNEPAPTEGNEEPEEDDVHGGKIYDIQKVIVITSKVDEEGNFLEGAKLQILDEEGNILDEWISGDKAHETELPDGIYTLHEVEAPEGYDLAEDQEFTVKVEIKDIDAGSDASATPCPHYTGTQMYYVEIKGVKHETYCINQNWNTPDSESQYDGEILNPSSIRDYTKQTIPVDVDPDSIDPEDGRPNSGQVLSSEPLDVSDKSLSDEELYNKILDIIYHRHIATQYLEDSYTTEEIRFITEVALKNYTNAGLAERQFNVNATPELLAAFDEAGVVYKTYNDGKKVSYIKHNYRDFVYTPDVPLGKDIVKTDYGKGNSFGQMVAGHWNYFTRTDLLHPDATPGQTNHNAKNKQADRDTVARYYRLFEFLISNENPHPEDMNLYIYSSETTPSDPDSPDKKYQNLLGVTGYFEEFTQQTKDVKMTNKYSTEKTSVTVKKVWDDNNNQDGKRPESITVKLSNGESVTLNEKNNWEATIENLPKYEKGNLITYTWTEDEKGLPEGYKLTNTEVNGTITTFTNSYTPEVRDIKVSKVWYDNDNEYEVRVKKIKVDVIANGEVIKTITLSDDNEWTETLEKLPVYENGKEIKYEVSEFEVENYKVIIEEGKEGFVIYNYYDAKGGENPPDDTPKTGDTIYSSVISLVLSSLVFTSSVYIKKRYN